MNYSPISDANTPNAPGEDLRIARPRVGVALSSGAARGLAHVGVIQVLEENGIPVDAIAATSMGAYVGALWAYGLDGQELEDRAREDMTSRWDVIRLVDPCLPPRRGFIHGRRVRRLLENTIGPVHFEALPRNLSVVATELANGSERVFDSGPVGEAVHASLAIPGIVKPVEIEGVEYVDGGIVNPLPVDLLRRLGMDIVIGVSVIPTVEELTRENIALGAGPRPRGLFRRALGFANRHLNYFAKGNILDILRRAATLPQIQVAELALKRADVGVRPVVGDGGFHDYNRFEAYIEAGRAAAGEKIATIKRLSTEPPRRPVEKPEKLGRMPI